MKLAGFPYTVLYLFLCCCWILCPGSAAAQSPSVDLRGYGRVTATFTASQADFECQTRAKADMLLGKLLADMFWDAGSAHQVRTVSAQGKDIPVHLWEGYGAVCVYRDGSHVRAIGADSGEALVDRLQNENALHDDDDIAFQPSAPYPVYLDYYDLRSFRFYTGAMGSSHKLGLETHWPFMKQFGIGGIAFQQCASWSHSPADGVLENADGDYEVREAAKNGGMAVPCPGGGEVGLWAFNRNPFEMKQPSPTALLAAWGGVGEAGAHYESAGIPDSANIQNVVSVMKRYVNNPGIGGWQPYAGSPGAEMSFHDRAGDWWDYSPAGQECFRRWLSDVKGYTLPGLGQAWWNNPSAYRTWQDVTVPDALSFFGDLDTGSLLLNGGWYWKRQNIDETGPPAASDAAWVPFDMPPSQKEAFLPWGDAFYRTDFDATAWLSRNSGAPVYLVCGAWIRTKRDFQIWLNGQPVATVSGSGQTLPFSVEVTGHLTPSRNELTILVPSGAEGDTEGKLLGPVFLTTHKPASYPYLGREANARYVDLKDWQAYSVYLTHVKLLEAARGIDPERPMNLSPGSSANLADYANELGARFGVGLQMTGREAWYHPWWDGYGLIAGYYGTGEPSDTAHGAVLSRMLGWSMYDADGSATLIRNIEDYMTEEQTNGWFTANKRNIQLFGKYLREQPGLVLFRTAENALLGMPSFMRWDVGTGDLQRAHFDYAYASERELALGLVDKYPVLFDTGSEVLTDRMLKDIARYVSGGGVFVALHNTGLHTPTEADSYPFGALCGYQIANKAKSGKLRFEADPPIFKGWSGREFTGEGIALSDAAGGGGDAGFGGAQPIARWADGTTAIGYRKIGRGAVIVLGSTFWRDGHTETEFFEQLLGSLGIQRDANASEPGVWTRKVYTKNGLQDWLIAFNSNTSEVQSDLSFRLAAKPAQVINLETNQPVNFDFSQDGWVTVKGVNLPGYGIAAFAVKRASLVAGIPTWWSEKTTYWKHCAPMPPVPAAQSPGSAPTVNIDSWRFFADRDSKLSAGDDWKQLDYSDAGDGWRDIATGPWNYQSDDLKDYNGAGLYRAKVNLPLNWPGRTITLNLYSFDLPIVYDDAEFFLNGKSVAHYQARHWSQTLAYDVTAAVQPGQNILAVRVNGGSTISGIAGCVWFGTEKPAREEMALNDNWKVVKADYVATENATLPGKVTGKYLTRDVDIPASWRDQSVYLHIETPDQWLGSVLVNGRPINYNGYLHPFGIRTEVNVTPYIEPGGKNTFELWPFITVPRSGQAYPLTAGPDSRSETPMNITRLSLKRTNN